MFLYIRSYYFMIKLEIKVDKTRDLIVYDMAERLFTKKS